MIVVLTERVLDFLDIIPIRTICKQMWESQETFQIPAILGPRDPWVEAVYSTCRLKWSYFWVVFPGHGFKVFFIVWTFLKAAAKLKHSSEVSWESILLLCTAPSSKINDKNACCVFPYLLSIKHGGFFIWSGTHERSISTHTERGLCKGQWDDFRICQVINSGRRKLEIEITSQTSAHPLGKKGRNL